MGKRGKRALRVKFDGKLPLEKLLTRRYSLDQINEAFDDLEQRKVGRPLIAFSDHRA